jgi:hypothetical protein
MLGTSRSPVAGGLKDNQRAFEILERARGRAAADALRSLPTQQSSPSGTKAPARSARSPLCKFASSKRQRPGFEGPSRQTGIGRRGVGTTPLRSASLSQFLRGDPVSLDALRNTMREDELIVEYVLADPASFASSHFKGCRRQELASKAGLPEG